LAKARRSDVYFDAVGVKPAQKPDIQNNANNAKTKTTFSAHPEVLAWFLQAQSKNLVLAGGRANRRKTDGHRPIRANLTRARGGRENLAGKICANIWASAQAQATPKRAKKKKMRRATRGVLGRWKNSWDTPSKIFLFFFFQETQE
jgi:hypothetical protein